MQSFLFFGKLNEHFFLLKNVIVYWQLIAQVPYLQPQTIVFENVRKFIRKELKK